MNINLGLSLPRDEASIPVVRHVCRDSMQLLGVEEVCVENIELAVTEACTNVLKHAAEASIEYEVTVEIDDTTCHIRVHDDAGEGFDHASQGVQEAHKEAEGGRGIFIMRAMMDELRFESLAEDGAVVHLVKNLELRDDSVLKALAIPA